MITLEDLKERLRVRLIEHDGNIAPHDLLDLVEEAQELGIDKAQIARLVPEVDRSINWEHIRAEKAKAVALQQQEQEKAAARRKEIEAAPEYLDALISYCMADGAVEAEELRSIFRKAGELEQSKLALAGKIRELLDKGKFRPYPNANLDADGLHEVLMSTNWYTEKAMPASGSQPIQPEQPAPAPAIARIHHFSVDKTHIKRGQQASISWEVSGVKSLTISNLGATTSLTGRQLVQPTQTIIYRLTAGHLQQEIEIVVEAPNNTRRLVRIALWLIAAYLIIRLIAWGAEQLNITSDSDNAPATENTTGSSSASQLSVGSVHAASDVSSSEEAGIVQAMNNYLQIQEEDNISALAISKVCDLYAYPVTTYFSTKNASRQFVYDDVLRYRTKFRPNHWAIDPSQTQIRKLPGGDYAVSLAGSFSYYVRNPKGSNGYRERYVYNKYRLNSDYKITSVYEVK